MNSQRLFRFSNLVRLLLLAFYFAVVYYVITIFSSNYEDFVQWILSILDRSDLEGKVRSVIQEDDFSRLKKVSFFLLLPFAFVIGILLLKLETLLAHFSRFFNFLTTSINSFVHSIRQLPKSYFWAFVLISLVYMVKAYWYVFNWPMQYDEAWTFNHFISKPWIVSLTAPHNNHILYTLLAKVSFHGLPFLRPIVAIRFILPLFGLASGFVFYAYVKEKWNEKNALLAYAFFLSCGPIVFYALYARAYMVSIFFNVLFLYSFSKFLDGRDRNLQVIAVLSAVLSIYALPTSIYFLFPVILVYSVNALVKSASAFKPLLITGLAMIAGVIILYSPIIIATKMSWLTDGLQGKKFDLNYSLRMYYGLSAMRFSGFAAWRPAAYVIGVLSILPLFIFKNRRKEFLLILISLFIPMAYMVLHQKYLFARIFSYNAIFYSILMASLVAVLLKRKNHKLFVSVLSIVIFLFFSYKAHYQNFFNWSNPWDNQTEELFDVLKENDIRETYNFFYYAKPAMEYFEYERKHNLEIVMPQESSITHQAFSEREWESVVWWNDYNGEQPDLTPYKIIWESKELKLYVLGDHNP